MKKQATKSRKKLLVRVTYSNKERAQEKYLQNGASQQLSHEK